MIAASRCWIVAFDNLSHLPVWLSNGLCRLATGGGFGTRTLYSDDEETLFDAMRPVVITAIEHIAARGDLIDRMLTVRLPAIARDKRKTEDEIFAEYERMQPRVPGALCDAVATALAGEDAARSAIKEKPR